MDENFDGWTCVRVDPRFGLEEALDFFDESVGEIFPFSTQKVLETYVRMKEPSGVFLVVPYFSHPLNPHQLRPLTHYAYLWRFNNPLSFNT